MPSIKNIEKIPSLVVSGSTASLTPVGSIQVNIGPQSYRTTSTLSATLAGLTAGSLYMVYLVPSNGSIILVISANVNSVGPAGYSNWRLVGGILATSATTGAAIANIYGVPETDYHSYTPTGAWNTNVTYTGIKKMKGDISEYYVKIALSGAPNAANLNINQPTGESINAIVADTQNDTLGTWNYHDNGSTIYTAGLTVEYQNSTTVLLKVNPNGLMSTTASFSDGAANTLITMLATDEVHIRYSVPITGWSSTPLALR